MKRLFLFLIIISYTISYGRLGGSGASFLEIGSGGKALALSGAYSALAEGIDALYYNPSGIAKMKQNALQFSYTPYFADMTYQTVGAVFNLGMLGNVGFSFITLQSGDIEITTLEEQNGTGEFYNANDYALGISFARELTDKFSAGGTIKFIKEGIDEVSSFGWSVDLGATYNTGWKNLRFGFAILNFGPDMQFKGDALKFHTRTEEDNQLMEEDVLAEYETKEYPLPLIFQIGVAYDVVNTPDYRLTLAFDKVNPTDQDETFAVGTEFVYRDLLRLRAGYSDRNTKNFSAGAGLKLNLGGAFAIIDYTFQNHKYLSALHTFTVSFMF